MIALVMVVIEGIHMLTFLIHIIIKAKRGWMNKLGKLYIYMNVPYGVMLIYMIIYRFMFTSMVCLCDFKKPYMTLREEWDNLDGTKQSSPVQLLLQNLIGL